MNITEIITDRKFQLMTGMFILFLLGIVFYASYSGLLLILSLFVFGGMSIIWKAPHLKLAGLAFLVILALANISLNGMKYGIDFQGGTRIPVLLEKPVSSESMNELVQIIKKRASVLGLTENKVQAIGDMQINVEVPSSDEKTIENIEYALSHQGVYWGIVDGKIAIDGANIYSNTITQTSPSQLTQSGADWGVSFSVNRNGAEQFAAVAKGKADYPVYMYLDRPIDAVIFITRSDLKKNMPEDSSEKEALKALEQALELDQNQNIGVLIIDDLGGKIPAPKSNLTKAIITSNTSETFKGALNASGYLVREYSESEISPAFNRTSAGVLTVGKLDAVGLMSSPTLSAGLTSGVPSYGFQVTGSVDPNSANKAVEASANVKKIESILKGGSLPVQISLGSRTTLPASLGQEFLKLSLIGIAGSLLIISLFIGLRYRNLKAVLPIIAISISELIILLAILGSFTIDLAAMAGIIAAIGIGVDAQIVITDELLKRDDEETTEEKVEHAFDIIKTNVIVATLSMIPLLFSGLVEVIGFAISTILGSLLGFLLSRPAYSTIVGMIIEKKPEDAVKQ